MDGRPREIFKTFVGGLPFHCNEQELGLFMSQFGTVHEVYISRDPSGYHKGFAFVNFISVQSPERLFGEHYFKSKLIEVKQNLHNQLLLLSLPDKTDECTIRKAIEELGFLVAEVILGSESNGVPPGSASVKLFHEDQVNQALAKEKVLIKDTEVEISSRATKRPTPTSPQVKDLSGKKKSRHANPHNSHNVRDSDKRIPRSQGLSFSNLSSETFDQTESLLELIQSMNRISINGDSEPSTVDFGALAEPDSAQFIKPIRKLSSSLKTNSKEYFPSPSKTDSLQLAREASGALSLDSDSCLKVPVTARHNSECGILTEADTPLGKRLNGCSNSFYSGGFSGQGYFSSLSRPQEIRIRFFTFPDRE